MPNNHGIRVAHPQLPKNTEKRGFLTCRSGVCRLAITTNAANVAHTHGAMIIAGNVRTNLIYGAATLNGTIVTHNVMIANATPTLAFMPSVDFLCPTVHTKRRGRAMHNDITNAFWTQHRTRLTK